VARYERRRRGEPAIDPDPSLDYAENFLTMLRGEAPTAEEARALEVAMILHAEHEMNASTFTARVVAGTNADMHSAIVAAISALKGPLHGGANQAAIAMFEEFGSAAGVPGGVRARLESKRPLYGFGHPLYRAMDPRAPILRRLSEQFADESEPNFLEIAQAAEREAREQKSLWPNVDLYSGVLYHYLGIPTDLFIPLFEMSRVAGQAAHVLEQHAGGKIIRPSAEYVGEPRRDYPVREPS
jgi:citrate synthase